MRESDRIGSALRSGLHSIRLNFHSSNRPDRVCPAWITRICNSNVRRTHVTRALVVHFVCSFDGLIRLTLGAHTHRAHNDRIRQANEGCCYHNQPYTSLKFGWSTAVAIAARADQRRTPFGGVCSPGGTTNRLHDSDRADRTGLRLSINCPVQCFLSVAGSVLSNQFSRC